jgi:hypothetical protein
MTSEDIAALVAAALRHADNPQLPVHKMRRHEE